MKWYFWVLIVLIVFAIVYFIASELIVKKNIYTMLLNNQEKNGKKRYELFEARSKGYDFVLKNDKVNIYIKYCTIPSNSQICINAKETWVLNSGGNKNNKGRAYPNKTFLKDLEYYLKNDIEDDNKALKVVLLYKKTEGIVRYINESELETVDIKKSPYGYKVMQYATFNEEIDYILNLYNQN